MGNTTDVIYDVLGKLCCDCTQSCDLYLLIIDDVVITVQNVFLDGNNILRLHSSLQKQMSLSEIC